MMDLPIPRRPLAAILPGSVDWQIRSRAATADPRGPVKVNTVGAGIAIGAGVGAAIGVAMGNIAAGVGVGIAIGAAIGASMQNRNR